MKEKTAYTRYEKTRIISARALQIAQGSPVLTKVPRGMIDPIEIAKMEWDAEIIPIDIKIRGDEPVVIEEGDGVETAEEPEQEAEEKLVEKAGPEAKGKAGDKQEEVKPEVEKNPEEKTKPKLAEKKAEPKATEKTGQAKVAEGKKEAEKK